MEYEVEFRPKAVKDLDSLHSVIRERVIEKVQRLRNNLEGDVARLTNFVPDYRLRVGDYRVLFAVAGTRVVVYRVRHRREVYR